MWKDKLAFLWIFKTKLFFLIFFFFLHNFCKWVVIRFWGFSSTYLLIPASMEYSAKVSILISVNSCKSSKQLQTSVQIAPLSKIILTWKKGISIMRELKNPLGSKLASRTIFWFSIIGHIVLVWFSQGFSWTVCQQAIGVRLHLKPVHFLIKHWVKFSIFCYKLICLNRINFLTALPFPQSKN